MDLFFYFCHRIMKKIYKTHDYETRNSLLIYEAYPIINMDGECHLVGFL